MAEDSEVEPDPNEMVDLHLVVPRWVKDTHRAMAKAYGANMSVYQVIMVREQSGVAPRATGSIA